VQDTDEPDLRAEPFWVRRNLQHGGGAGMEKQVVHNPGVTLAESVQLMRQGEYDVEVRDGKEFLFPSGEPALASLCLTLRTMPVSAGVIRDGLMTAPRASIDVTAQRRSPATPDGAQDAQLLVAEPRTSVDEVIALPAE
jgi:hypothetical protein